MKEEEMKVEVKETDIGDVLELTADENNPINEGIQEYQEGGEK